MKKKLLQEDTILFLVSTAHWNLHGKLKKKFKKEGFNVTPDQWYILLNLMNEGPRYQSQLAVSQNKDRAAIKRLIDHLLRKQLVVKKNVEKDNRKKMISLSVEGLQIINQMNPLATETFKESNKSLTEVERSALKRLIIKVIKNIT